MRLTAFACFPCEFLRACYCNLQSIARQQRNMDNTVVNAWMH